VHPAGQPYPIMLAAGPNTLFFFLFSYVIFFSYDKEEMNLLNFCFYIVQKLGDDKKFSI